jgi:hypothetical protein
MSLSNSLVQELLMAFSIRIVLVLRKLQTVNYNFTRGFAWLEFKLSQRLEAILDVVNRLDINFKVNQAEPHNFNHELGLQKIKSFG